MTYTRILTHQCGSVVEVTLNRPEIHNAFDELLIAELTQCIASLSDDATVRAIVLRGEGPSFCAGADLAWMRRVADFTHDENIADSHALRHMFATISHCPKATIARVHGAAIGGGAGLVAACDIAIAAESARFALSEVRLGLVPAVIGPYVIEKIGVGAARALFVTGERISAAEAFRLGLVQQITPMESLDAAIDEKLALVKQASPAAIDAAKRLLRDISGKSPAESADITVACIAGLRVSAEGQEGIRAFLEKRKPEFAE